MKIGIMTIWNSTDNYGQQMQLYALQKYLKDKGHEPFLIKYFPSNDVNIAKKSKSCLILKIFNLRKLFNYINYKMNQIARQLDRKYHPRFFEEFRYENIQIYERDYYTINQLKDAPPSADMYLVGSDQVWNFYGEEVNVIKNKIHAFFLDFGDNNIIRVSYAASWGRADVTDEEKQEITPLLEKFQSISVREKTGIDLCKKCGRDDATWACDPTLLLKPDDYRTLYENKVKKPENKYILLYYVNNGGKFNIHRVFSWARSRGLQVIYVTGNNKYDRFKKKYASLPEWLCLIDYAEYVITNSFHCCIFSMIFKKKFACIRITGEREGMNTRVESLFEICNMKPRFIKDYDFSVLEFPVENIKLDEKHKGNINYI